MYEQLGSKEASGIPESVLDELRADLASLLAGSSDLPVPEEIRARIAAHTIDTGPVCDEERGFRSVFRPGLMEAFARATEDLERDLWGWLRTGAPSGISGAIPESGIFPPVSTEPRSRGEFEELVSRISAAEFANYKSFEEEPAVSRGEIERMGDAKFLREFDTLEKLEAYVGGKVPH